MATILNPTKLLAYGENDGTVIWQSPLTSEASIFTPVIGSSSVFKSGANQAFDPVKGFKGNADGSTYIMSAMANNSKLDFGGQLTFQVQTAQIACTNATAEGSSGGTAQVGNEVLISFYSASFPNGNYQSHIQIFDKLLNFHLCDGISQVEYGSYFTDAVIQPEFSTIHVTWNCNSFYMYVNGVLFKQLSRTVNFPGSWDGFRLGNYVYGGAGPLTSGYIRNLQISYRLPVMPVHPLLANVCVFGDSYAATNTNAWVANSYNTDKLLTLTKGLRDHGFDVGSVQNQSYGGRRIIGSGNPAIYLSDNVVTMLATNPSLIIFQAGANDYGLSGALNTVAFTAAMKSEVERWFGVNGNPKTTVLRAVICTTPWPPGYPTAAQAPGSQADHALGNNIQQTMPAWFDATYPSLAGRLVVQDTFADFGGFNPDPLLFAATDPIHPSIGKGWYTMGNSWLQGVLKAIR